MRQPIRILHLEDNQNDVALVQGLLEADGLVCEILVVESRVDLALAIERERFDMVISDFSLPSYDGRSALLLVREKCPDVPYLFFSGTIGEDAAIEALKSGATDYVVKQRPARLVAAVRRALEEARERAERKRAEETLYQMRERFKGIFDSSKDAIGYLTLDGLFLDINPAFEKLTGYSRQELLTMTYQALTPVEYRRTESDVIDAVIKTEEPVEYEKLLIRKDGVKVPVAHTVFAVRGRSGNPEGLAGIIKDITERKQAEDELRKTEAQLHHAQKLEGIGQLAGGIAHDFNNLLTVINGYSELILQTIPPSHSLRDQVVQIKEAGRRASLLTQQILAFSRNQPLAPIIFNLNDAVASMDKLLRRLIGEHIILVTTPGLTLRHVHADQGQIEQVIMNLAVNARDAMPNGGTLTIETENVELGKSTASIHPPVQPGPYVRLAVRDTGCGMDAATQARIFEPFFTTKEQGKGTGLGLSTVYGIVTQSEGAIEVKSEVGQGTTFCVYLPCAQGAAEPVAPADVSLELPKGTETILLVEDEDMVRNLTRRVLREQGYMVLDARHGSKAQEISAKYVKPIHLLLTDLVMPGINGHDMAVQMQAMRPEMKVLYVSGYADKVLSQQVQLPVGTPFLYKPFTPNVLAHKVREVLDGPPAAKEHKTTF